MPKNIHELRAIRTALEVLLGYGNWLGDTKVLEDAYQRVSADIDELMYSQAKGGE